MGILIQVRDVPDDVHRTLKSRAALEGVSLSEYIRSELQRVADSPTPDELMARLGSRKRAKPRETSAEALHAVRADRS